MQLVTSLALLALAATGVLAQPQINTPPSITECEPTDLTFSGGVAPYIISVIPGGQTTAPAIEILPQTSGTSLTWNADIASGTSITFAIKDSTGQTAFSAIVTIQAGTSTACVGKNSASGSATGTASGSASGTSAASASGASSSSSAASSGASVSSPSSAAGSTATSGATSAAKPASSAASATSASASAATSSSAAMKIDSGWASGAIGMLLAALLA